MTDTPQPKDTATAKLAERLAALKDQMRYRHTADLIVRSDGVDHRYEADWLDNELPKLIEAAATERVVAFAGELEALSWSDDHLDPVVNLSDIQTTLAKFTGGTGK